MEVKVLDNEKHLGNNLKDWFKKCTTLLLYVAVNKNIMANVRNELGTRRRED